MNPEQMEIEKEKAIAKGQIPKISPFLLILPTLCDFITSSLAFFALELMPPSVYSMIRGGNVIVTALFSKIFLKSKLYRQHYLGMFLLIAGLASVGLVQVLSSKDDNQSTTNLIVGICLLVSSFLTFSTQVTLEQKYFSKYSLNPFQVVGLEGCWGLLISGISIVFLQMIPCSKNMECPMKSNGKSYLEAPLLFFQQVFSFSGQKDQPMLIIMIFLGIIAILFFNVLQMTVTKFISSLARNIISVTAPCLVWIFSLSIGWEKFSWGQLGGFIVLTIGSLIYNEIIVLPFWGFNTNLKKNQSQPEKITESSLSEALVTKDEARKSA